MPVTIEIPTIPSWVKSAYPALLVGLVLLGYDRLHQGGDSPSPYIPSVVTAAKQYRVSTRGCWDGIAQQIQQGSITKKDQIKAALNDHAMPLEQGLDSALAPLLDKDENITNPAAAAAVFRQIAEVLK